MNIVIPNQNLLNYFLIVRNEFHPCRREDCNCGEEIYEIYHWCGYENKPTQTEIDLLRHELETDEEFGLQDSINDLIIEEAGVEQVKYIREEYIKTIAARN